jgi:SAM-dependent methyltransferase
MGFDILRSKTEIRQARSKLKERGLSFLGPEWKRLANRIKLNDGIIIGDEIKSWDILKTANFIERNVEKDMAVLDIGAYASEILFVLNQLGFSNLTGIDLNPRIMSMPLSGAIRFGMENFMHTKFSDESFNVITAISVVEHGFKSKELLSEISRLLKPGGFFISSFDYWPDKIDTNQVKMFDMDWTIFSEKEVKTLILDAESYQLTPSERLDFEAGDSPIRCAGKNYTFAWLVLKKKMSA